MTVLLLDAYSSTNVGDLRLVELSRDYCRKHFVEDTLVLATDPESFAGLDADVLSKPLSRFEWRARVGVRRMVWLLRDFAGILLVCGLSYIPNGLGRALLRLSGKLLDRPWMVAVSGVTHAVGVGGGYIGDAYFRESMVSLLMYRAIGRFGAEVETMPISIASLNSKVLRHSLSTTRNVRWRARELVTAGYLRGLQLNVQVVPDLVWSDWSDVPRSSGRRSGVAIAPVGAEFYGGEVGEELMKLIRCHVDSDTPRVELIAMHRWSERLADGGDDRVAEKLSLLLADEFPSCAITLHTPLEYAGVQSVMAGCELAICERLHAALAAATTNTPFIVSGYEPKHRGVLELAGLGAAVVGGDDCRLPSAQALACSGRHSRSLVENGLGI